MLKIDWPQAIFLFFLLAQLIIIAAANGKPREGSWNWPLSFMRALAVLGLLYWGGFFS